MKIWDLISLSFKNVGRGGIKSFLCAMAVCVGICSVCVVSGLGSAVSGVVKGQVEQMGIGGIIIYSDGAPSSGITQEDANTIVQTINGVKAAMPLAIKLGSISLRSVSRQAAICGVNQSFENVFNTKLLYGRYLKNYDLKTSAKVAIIDNEFAKSVYGRENIIGKTLYITCGSVMEKLEIVGIVRSQTSGLEMFTGGGSLPSFIYMPYTTIETLCGTANPDALVISCLSAQNTEKVAKKAVSWLERSKSAAFSYQNAAEYTDTLIDITATVSTFANAVALISVIVGGIGVMNSMTVSVENRMQEIGIYMALGGRKKDILFCFLIESVVLCVLGGITGAGASALIFLGIKKFFYENLIITMQFLLVGIASALVCGAVFGIMPAARAANLNPIDAIKDN